MYNSQFGGTTPKTNVHYRGRKYSTKVKGTVFKKKCQFFPPSKSWICYC